ncbi:DNA topology modulation protein FlaR [Streptococcus hyointestinalis]|uniref:DNA topology modulation protein FlaR n=1 Tax=Streptococcus hyointestinalis TaxID=1337 RepID=UPI003D031BEE
MKMVIIGYSGAGKSTLAKKLADFYKLPLLHLDKLRFLSNWQARSKADITADIQAFLDTHDSWVMEGNLSSCLFEERLNAADKIIILHLPRLTCLKRAYKRYRQHRGYTRDSMAEGCPERFDLDFIKWILIDGRHPKIQKQFQSVLENYSDKTFHLTSQMDIDTFLQDMKK